MQQIGVYQIKLNGKIYIGSTSQGFKKRYNSHLFSLRRGTHHNYYLQNAYNKYGEGSLEFIILEIVERPKDCIPCEQKWIDELKPEYNLSPTAGSALGTFRTEDSRKRISESHKGYKVREETKIKISNSTKGKPKQKGFKQSEETIRKRSEKLKGNKHTLGHKLTEEHKRKISEAGRGRVFTEEHKRKISESHMGHKYLLGYKYSEEAKQKMKEAQTKRRLKERELKENCAVN